MIVGKRPPPKARPEAPLDYALSGTGVTWGNSVTLLPGGADAFPSMLAAIEAARTEVLLETYILEYDDTGSAFMAALRVAAARGCSVRLIADGVGAFGFPSSRLAELERAGALTMVYRPIAPWRPRWGLWRRDHRKMLIIDGEVGFLGGLNISDEYDDRRHRGRPWRDLHVRLEGPSVLSLRHLFAGNWNHEHPADKHLAGTRGLEERETTSLSAGVAVQVIGNSGVGDRSYLRRAFLYAVKRSQRCVLIANPYFIPDRTVVRALSRAARRGVEVRVIIPERSDLLMCDLASRAALPQLLAAGVRVAEWRSGMMHAKAACVDGRWATVGSYNLDRRSLSYNLEVTANFLDIGVASTVEQQLLADFNASSAIDPASFSRRPFWLKALQALAYRFRSFL